MANVLTSAVALAGDVNFEREWQAVSRYFKQEDVRVAVLGPFNQGKSTLLNALLGSRHLPFDIVPTTAAAIFVRHGDELTTVVGLRDGSRYEEKGCSLLERFATLDEHRRMRDDVASVEVRVPHPVLGGGVTIVDLPGTNDRPEQEALIKEELFYSDVVIQVLNARQLNTLEEETNLDRWVIDSGVQHVLFVVNFCNLLDEADCAAVLERAGHAVARLSAKLSAHSRLYRVDALPALRAQLSGEAGEVERSGLAEFAAGLQTLAAEIRADWAAHRLPRVKAFAARVLGALREQHKQCSAVLSEAVQRREHDDKQRAQRLDVLRNGFEQAAREMRRSLDDVTLRANYATALTTALRGSDFARWRKSTLQPHFTAKLSQLNDIFREACAVSQVKPYTVALSFPSAPSVSLPEEVGLAEEGGGRVFGGAAVGATLGTFLLPGLGTVLGAVVGGWVGKSAREEAQEQRANALADYNREVESAYEDAANAYLEKLGAAGRAALDRAERKWEKASAFKPSPQTPEEPALRQRVSLLQQQVGKLEKLLDAPAEDFSRSAA